MVFAGLFSFLAGQLRFVRLDVVAREKFDRHRLDDGRQQFRRPEDGSVQRLPAQFHSVIFLQQRAEAVDRLVLLEFGGQHFDDEACGKLALGHDLHRRGCGRHPFLGQAMRTALLALDDVHQILGGYAVQWLIRHRRLVRDYERTDTSAEGWAYIAMIRIQLRRLA